MLRDTSDLAKIMHDRPGRTDLCRRLPGEEVTLTFRLDEPVTPDHLALRVPSAPSREHRIMDRS